MVLLQAREVKETCELLNLMNLKKQGLLRLKEALRIERRQLMKDQRISFETKKHFGLQFVQVSWCFIVGQFVLGVQ